MNQKILIILAIIGGVVSLLAFRSCNSSKAPRYNWDETYADDKGHVYGTYIVKRFLDQTSTNDLEEVVTKLSKHFNSEDSLSGNYIFVGEAMKVDESDAEALVAHIENGNHAIIAAQVFPNTVSKLIFTPCREEEEEEVSDIEELIGSDFFEEEGSTDEYEFEEEDTLLEEVDSISVDEQEYIPYNSWIYRDKEYLDFSGSGYKGVVLESVSDQNESLKTDTLFKTRRNAEPYYRTWRYLHDSLACLENNNIKVLGYISDTLINFFEIPFGQGSFLIHTNPMAFTNANMLNDTSAQYIMDITNNVASNTWHWDEYSKITRESGMRRNGNRTKLSNKGPLTYLLKQESLAWAWYSLLAMSLLFLVFKAKRKQRVIPVLEENENTSLAFINTIGSLYFRKNDHKQLCKDQMQLWLEDIRDQYRINTSKLNEEFISKLSAKTKVKPSEIEALIAYYHNIENSNFVSENTMIQFYQKLNQFAIQSN